MKIDSIIVGVASVLVTAVIIGGVYYTAVARQLQSSEETTKWETLEPRDVQARSNNDSRGGNPSTQDSARTDIPIKCKDPVLGEFWTNAATCESADLENRISIAEPLVKPEPYAEFEGKNYSEPQTEASRNSLRKPDQELSQEPDLRGPASSPPEGLSPECRFPVGKALETERALSAAEDPAASIWRDDYCRWLREVAEHQCEVSRDLFYYRRICGAF